MKKNRKESKKKYTDKDKFNERYEEYYFKNQDTIQEQIQEYQDTNKDKIKAYDDNRKESKKNILNKNIIKIKNKFF